MSLTTTRAPSCANRSAMALPMPAPEPVIRAFLSSSRMGLLLSYQCDFDPRVPVGVARLHHDRHRAQMKLAARKLDRVERRGNEVLISAPAPELVVLPGVVDHRH